MTETISNSRVELGILESFDQSDIASAVEAIRAARPLVWTRVGDWAQFRRTDEGQILLPMFDGAGAQVRVAGDTAVKGPGKSVVIRWERVDTRARLALERKRAQVRAGVCNAVVIDVCAVGGTGDWPETIAQLPGTDFEKIGTVLFFDQGCLGPPERVRRRWRVIDNPCASLCAPQKLLSAIESLDDSQYYGMPRRSRLSMRVPGSERGPDEAGGSATPSRRGP